MNPIRSPPTQKETQMSPFAIVMTVISVLLVLWLCYDIMQKKHAILHNFPIIGHFRYWLEAIGPELRQYIVTNNDEERPFNRDQRRWVYASSKQQNNYFGLHIFRNDCLHKDVS